MSERLVDQTMSSREFNQDLARAKRAAKEGPVVITDRGREAYVLMTHDYYLRGAYPSKMKTLFDMLADDSPEADFDFDPPKLDIQLRIPDLCE